MAFPIELPQVIVQYPLPTILLLLLTHIVYLSIYRLCFHPLSKFPGPKLAALTVWYEFYYDGIKRGKYVFEVGKMHEKYGINMIFIVLTFTNRI